jgi:hypothetical protein
MPAGRPTKLNDEMRKMALDYIGNYETVHEHPLPSAVGMASILKVAKSTLYKWAETDEDFSDTLALCNTEQELNLIHKGLTNDFNPTIVKLALANHGYSESSKQELTGANGGSIQIDSVFEFVPVGSTHEAD